MPTLSKRLKTIASLVPDGARVCDVGCDHGYLSIELVKTEKASLVIATDVKEKPLNKARTNAEKMGVSGIDFRLQDGLLGITVGEIDTAVIAGMGAEVIVGILKSAEKMVKSNDLTLIFQPTTSPEILREYLYTNGFAIKKEIPIFENEKLYSVMLVKFENIKQSFPTYRYFIGELNTNTVTGKMYIEKQYNRVLKCANDLKNTSETEKYLYFKALSDDIGKFLTANEEK